MNPQKLSNALRKLGEASYELADALLDTSSTGTLDQGRGMADAASPSGSPVPTFSDGMPVEEPPLFPGAFAGEDMPITQPYRPPAPTAQDQILSECPVHFTAWTVKEGGISKNGKPYSAFWKCSGKDDDGSYCNKKPVKDWIKTHDPEKALAAA